jgi:hypothetical protein
MTMNDEETLISTFVNPLKRKHLIEILANPKRRHRATETLAHFHDLDPSAVVSLESTAQTPAAIESALRSRGAGDTCHVISENRAIDGKTLSLKVALEKVFGLGKGTLLSCVPGELAYYEGESPSDRCILARRSI